MKYGKAYLNEKLSRLMHRHSFSSPCLEVGCGTGETLKELLKTYIVKGIDLSAEAVAVCRQKGLPAEKAGLFDLDEKFNAVVCLDVIEHIKDDAAFSRQLHAVLNPGGKGFIVVPSGPMKQDDICFGHYRRYSKTSITALLKNAGFTVRHVEMLGYPFFYHARALANLTYPRRCPPDETPETRTLKSSYEHPFDRNILGKVLQRIETTPILKEFFLSFLRIQNLFKDGETGTAVIVVVERDSFNGA